MDSDTKKLIRAVVRRVHPDLFTAHPFERQRNSDSLKVGWQARGDVWAGCVGVAWGGGEGLLH